MAPHSSTRACLGPSRDAEWVSWQGQAWLVLVWARGRQGPAPPRSGCKGILEPGCPSGCQKHPASLLPRTGQPSERRGVGLPWSLFFLPSFVRQVCE